jgi:hypothetical protein
MKEENLMVVWALLIIALSSFAAIIIVVFKGSGDTSILNQLVLIPVSVVSVFGGYLTKSLADKIKEWKAKDDPTKPPADK